MNSYLITYDLVKPGQDYTDLFDAIKAIAATRWHCVDSTWIIKHDGGAAAIRDSLSPHLDRNDKLVVLKLSGEGAWKGLSAECSKWLKDNV